MRAECMYLPDAPRERLRFEIVSHEVGRNIVSRVVHRSMRYRSQYGLRQRMG